MEVEAQTIKHLHDKIEHLEEKRLDHIEQTLDEISARQRVMEKQMERYAARWGFVLMVGTALVAAVKFFWEDFAKIFGR